MNENLNTIRRVASSRLKLFPRTQVNTLVPLRLVFLAALLGLSSLSLLSLGAGNYSEKAPRAVDVEVDATTSAIAGKPRAEDIATARQILASKIADWASIS